jgi:hypothetical protein
MPKRLVIGIGGTGLDVIRNLRRRIVEANPEKGLGQYPSLGFLYIDTSPLETSASEDNRKRWEVLGQSIQLKQSEYVVIQAPAVGRILENLDSYPQLRDWLPIHELNNLDVAAKDTPGAQQIRPLGRMIFTLNYDTIKTQFTNALNSLRDDPAGGNPEVILACSLSGGTGAGMVLDIAYSVRRWLQARGLSVGYLVLPDLMEEAARGRRYLANAYAALMDLNYFSQRRRLVDGREVPIEFLLPKEEKRYAENPLDFCYLLSTRNQMRESLSLKSIPDLIAHRIYLSLDNRVTGDVADMMNNGAMQRGVLLEDPRNGNRFSQNFSTFGLSTIQYPTEQITEILSARLVTQLIGSWLESPPVDNVSQRISKEIPNLCLSDDYLFGNRDFFGQSQDFPSIPAEVEQILTAKLNATPVANRAPHLNQVFANFLDEYRGGLIRYYRALGDNMQGAADVVARRVRAHISAALTDPTLGYSYALAALDELARLLQVRRQALDTDRGKLASRVKGALVAKTAAVGEVTEAEGAIMFRESKVKEALHKTKVAMTMNLTAQIEDRAYEFASILIGVVLERLSQLKGQTIAWANNLVNLKSELEKESAGRMDSLNNLQKNKKMFNGVLLFRPDRVESLYGQLQRDEAALSIREHLLSAGDALDLDHSIESRRRFLDGALQWLSNRSTVRVSGKNVAQQLLEEYPGPQNQSRSELITRAYRASAPCLEFDQGEREAYSGRQGAAYSMDPTTTAHRAAMLDHDQNRLREVAQIRHEIVQATNLGEDHIKTISDTQQIVFLSELTAFPLRVVAEVRQLKDAYDAHMREKGHLPLHIQGNFYPPIGALMLMSEQEVAANQRREEDFLVAWTLGATSPGNDWLRSELNPIEGRQEIRYRYQVSGASQFTPLGDSRDAAFDRFCAPGLELNDLRTRVNGDIDRYFQKLISSRQRSEFASALYGVLDAMRTEYTFGEDDPRYKRYHEIRLRVVKRFQLLRDGEAPVPAAIPAVLTQAATAAAAATTPAPAPAPAPANLDRFTRYVHIAVDQVKGNPSEKLFEKIEAKRLEFGVSVADAQAQLEAALAPFRVAPAAPSPADQYREMLRDFLDLGNGDLNESAIAELIDFQASNDLDATQVAAIEADVRRSLAVN